jgi:hypothetical protein
LPYRRKKKPKENNTDLKEEPKKFSKENNMDLEDVPEKL